MQEHRLIGNGTSAFTRSRGKPAWTVPPGSGVSAYSGTASALIIGKVRTADKILQTSRYVIDWLYLKEIQNE